MAGYSASRALVSQVRGCAELNVQRLATAAFTQARSRPTARELPQAVCVVLPGLSCPLLEHANLASCEHGRHVPGRPSEEKLDPALAPRAESALLLRVLSGVRGAAGVVFLHFPPLEPAFTLLPCSSGTGSAGQPCCWHPRLASAHDTTVPAGVALRGGTQGLRPYRCISRPQCEGHRSRKIPDEIHRGHGVSPAPLCCPVSCPWHLEVSL